MGDSFKILELCLNLIKGNDFTVLFYIILFVISVWLFKEFRKNKIESDNINFQRMDTALGLYGKAINSINKYKNQSINLELLMDDLVLLYPYAPRKIIEYINTLKSEDKNVDKINEEIKKEVLRLKKLQYDSISNNDSDEIINSLDYYYKKNFESFIMPLLNTIVAITCILLFLEYVCIFGTKTSTINKIMVISLLFILPIYIITVMATCEIIDKKKFEISITNIVLVIILIALMPILFLPWKWFSGTIFIAYTLFYIAFGFKRITKKPH